MKIQKLEMIGFKKHIEPFVMNFTDYTEISGRNGSGKSTTADAVAFVLYGCDSMGQKIDPVNLETGGDVRVALEISTEIGVFSEFGSEGGSVLLERVIEKGKTKTYIEEAPVAATAYKDRIEGFVPKDLFLSMFNPNYFPNLHWKEQRDLMMSFFDTPLNETVLKEMHPNVADPLRLELKKLDLDKLEGKHKRLAKEAEEKLSELRGSLATYKKLMDAGDFDVKAAQDRVDELNLEISVYEEQAKYNRERFEKRRELQEKLDQIKRKMRHQADLITELLDAEDLSACHACGQDLPVERFEALENKRKEKIEEAKAEGRMLKIERDEAEEALNLIGLPIKTPDYRPMQNEMRDLQKRIDEAKMRDFSGEVERIEREIEEARKKKVDSVVLLDAVKEFKDKQTEITVKDVNELFSLLSVKLFEELKNGENRPTFEIEYNGRPYRYLSTAERIYAGLEVRNAFLKLTADKGMESLPVFVDNLESISDQSKLYLEGQLIVAKVTDESFTVRHGRDGVK